MRRFEDPFDPGRDSDQPSVAMAEDKQGRTMERVLGSARRRFSAFVGTALGDQERSKVF